MDYRLQVMLNNEEQKMFEDIREYYQKLFGMKLNNSMLLRFIIQKEWNKEQGIELEISESITSEN